MSAVFHLMVFSAFPAAALVWLYDAGATNCRPPHMEARIEVSQLENMVNTYYLSSEPKRLPACLNELANGPSPLTMQVPLDPWGNAYEYRRSDELNFIIFSKGPDGVARTDDDVTSFEELP